MLARLMQKNQIYSASHDGLGAKWRYVGYFGSSLHPPGREIWLLSWLKGMSWGLEKPCCTKLPVAGFL